MSATEVGKPSKDENDKPYTGDGVVQDDAPIDSGVDATTADSDLQLEKDDKEAIDTSNIIEERTRGAAPGDGYREPGDDEGLPGPGDSGASNV